MRSRARQIPAACALVAFALAILALPARAQDEKAPPIQRAPLNPTFVEHQKGPAAAGGLVLSADGFGLGRRPPPVDLSHATGQRVALSGWASYTPPAAYDLRTVSGKLPPVRNQGNCGDCWTFASYGSLESWLRPAETGWDFAEMDMNCSHGFDWGPCTGGNSNIATAFLAGWQGPVSESCYGHGTVCTSPRPACTQHKRLLEAIYLPDRESYLDNTNLKEAVATHGAVYTSMYWSDPAYRGAPYYTHYYTGSAAGNHAVCIVGWNDNFDRTRFVSPQPPANGAFIARNSWGASWGESGYFYVSYYDNGIGIENTVFTRAAPADDYSRVYQYDPYGWLYGMGWGSPTWGANIFTALAAEQVKVVGFFTPAINAEYQLYVYTNVAPGAPRSGTLAASISGTIAQMGYHTVELPTPANLAVGQRFSVVLAIRTPGYSYPLCTEAPISGYCSAATAGLGQSYVSYNGTSWSDLAGLYANENVCLKALVGPAGDTTPPIVTGVQVVGPLSVDITFSEPMGAGAIAAAHYTLSGSGRGSLASNPAAVVLFADNTYRLTWTAGEMKDGGHVTVCAAADVMDLAGNPVASPNCGTHSNGGIGTAPLVLACALPHAVQADDSCQGLVPDFTVPWAGLQATDNVTPPGLLAVTQSPAAGTPVGLGPHEVTLTVTDEAGNAGTCQTPFTVIDPDGDGVCGVHDLCPSSVPGAVVDATGCSNHPGDLDRDGDVDADDLLAFILCASGPSIPCTPECRPADLDGDGDVDSADFGRFQRCVSGANVPSSPTCAG